MKIVQEVSRFGGDVWDMLPSLLKPWEFNPLSRRPGLGYGRRIINVTGGIARTKWLTTLTGESPTSSAGCFGRFAVRPSNKSQTKCERRCDGTNGSLIPWVKGWQLFRSSPHTAGERKDRCERSDVSTMDKEKVIPAIATATRSTRPSFGKLAGDKEHLQTPSKNVTRPNDQQDQQVNV